MRETQAVLGQSDRSPNSSAIPKKVLQNLPRGVSAESFKKGACVTLDGGAIAIFPAGWGAPKSVRPPLTAGKEYSVGVRGTLVLDALSGETLKEGCALKDPSKCLNPLCLTNRGDCSQAQEVLAGQQAHQKVIIFAPGPILTNAVRRSRKARPRPN